MSDTQELIPVLKLLADPTRLRILMVLDGNELTVKELTEVLQIGQSTLSTQLGQLKEGQLVGSRKEGQFVYYRLMRFGEREFTGQLVKNLFEQLLGKEWYLRDSRKLKEILARRQEASLSYFNAQKAQNQVSPGQTWESFAIGLIQLVRGNRIVDLGCGIGRLSAMLAGSENSVVGVDNSAEQIAMAKKLNSRALGPDLNFVQVPMEATGLPEASFDIAIVSQALHHAPQPAMAIREAGRLLRSGGQLLVLDLVSHSQDWMQERFADFWLGFDPEDLKTWIHDAGFSKTELRICGPDPDYPQIETLIMHAQKT